MPARSSSPTVNHMSGGLCSAASDDFCSQRTKTMPGSTGCFSLLFFPEMCHDAVGPTRISPVEKAQDPGGASRGQVWCYGSGCPPDTSQSRSLSIRAKANSPAPSTTGTVGPGGGLTACGTSKSHPLRPAGLGPTAALKLSILKENHSRGVGRGSQAVLGGRHEPAANPVHHISPLHRGTRRLNICKATSYLQNRSVISTLLPMA